MLTAAAFVPSSPLLVPELTGRAVSETEPLRNAALDAGRTLSDAAEWVVVGVGAQTRIVPASVRGTFAAFGVDVEVALGPDAAGAADPMLPLPALIAGWLRGRVCPQVPAEVHVVAEDADPADCVALGKSLRDRLDADEIPRGLLVVADGAASLTAKAPGAYDARSEAVEAALASALSEGDVDRLASLDAALCEQVRLEGRAAWHVLAGVFAESPGSVSVTYSEAPYGVGYHAGVWRP